MDLADSPKTSTSKRILIFSFKVLLITVVFYFIYLQLRNNWDDIRTYDWHINSIGLLLLSILLALSSQYVFSAAWSYILRGFGHEITHMVAFRISYLSSLSRYVPGKVWQLFSIIYIARQHGLSAEKTTASFIISQLFMTVTAFLILAISAQIDPAIIIDQIALLGKGSAYLFTAGMVVMSLIVLVWPNQILAVANFFLKRFSRPQLSFSIDKQVALVIFLGYCVGWILYGLAFWMFMKSIVDDFDMSLVSATGIFAGSCQIGYLVLFAPGGIGPRELVMSQMLMPFLPGLAPMMAILSRLWMTLVEMMTTGISLLIKK